MSKDKFDTAFNIENLWDAALEASDEGWPVFPIDINGKKPILKWKEYQERRTSAEEIDDWFANGVLGHTEFNMGLATGQLSGIVVVDADTPEAIEYCEEHGLTSPIYVNTRRGRHYYWRHPQDGSRLPNKVGSNPGFGGWPLFDGLDFRGDGGYVLMSPSVSRKEGKEDFIYEMNKGTDFDELPVWSGYTAPAQTKFTEPELAAMSHDDFYANLDLTDVRVKRPDEYMSVWDRTNKLVEEVGKLAPGGSNGRNERVRDYTSELIMQGTWGADLRVEINRFMDVFFTERLPVGEVEATVRSMEHSERVNHPERFGPEGEYIGLHGRLAERGTKIEENAQERVRVPLVPMYEDDVPAMLLEAQSERLLIDPIMRPGSITQIYGYTGHGKSMFTLTLLWHLALGRDMGPYAIPRPAKTLYFDFENGRVTLGERIKSMKESYGSVGKNLGTWSPAVIGDDAGGQVNLNREEGMDLLSDWIDQTEPDVVVIDTIRSAWPGLVENSAEEWAKVNQLLISVRNRGIAIIVLHHANKPGENSLGREAGSSNQLTAIETQIRITQMWEDADVATEKGGKQINFDLQGNMEKLLDNPGHDRVLMWFEVTYGKVREWTDNHLNSCVMGMAEHGDGTKYIISQRSPRQKAVTMRQSGVDPIMISKRLMIPVHRIREWTGA